MSLKRIVIVGASLAGYNCARELRTLGFDGVITLIGAEPHRPYDRPPLSKQFLSGQLSVDDIMLETPSDVALDLDWRLGCPATGLDVASRRVRLASGETLESDIVVIATGTAPRRLEMSGRPGVHDLRSLDDAQALLGDLRNGARRLAVVGGGFIGTEVAATVRGLGVEVTIIEPQPIPLSGIVGAEIGDLIYRLHVEQGVDFRTGASLAGYAMDAGGRVSRLNLTDGTSVDVDATVVAIGVDPATGWLSKSGLDVGMGVLANSHCEVADGILVAGDVARWPNPRYQQTRRVEHWDNAVQQGRYVARRALNGPDIGPYEPVPWVWTDQYDLKVQIYGSLLGVDELKIVERQGDTRLVALGRRQDHLGAAIGINRAKSMLRYLSLLEQKALWSDAIS